MLNDTYAEICFNYKPKKKLTTPKPPVKFKSKQELYDFMDNLQAKAKLPPLEHQYYLDSFRSANQVQYKPSQCSKSVLVQRSAKYNPRLDSIMSDISTLEDSVLVTLKQINDSYSKEKKQIQEQENRYALLLQNLEQKNHITNTNWKTLIKHHFKNLNEYMDFATKDIRDEKNFVYTHQISTRNHYLFVDNEIRRNFLRRRKTKI